MLNYGIIYRKKDIGHIEITNKSVITSMKV